MFDSTPPNLPVGQVPKPAVAPPGMINQTGIKEPEDIFADIGDPELQASIGVPMTSAKAPVSRGFPWKIILGIGIPVAIIGLGYGAWSVYSTYRSATKPVQMPAAKTTQQPSVPVTAIPDNAPPPANPIAPPDEAKMAGTQAAIALMQAQAAKSDLQGEFATSNAPVMDTSTQALMEKLSATTTPPVAPPNIPAPQIAQTGGNAALKPAIDTDGDGLTNSEEAVLGTDPTKLDSDGDGFPDGSEVKGGYDPSAPKLKLMDSKYLKFETLGAMEFLIPKTWERKAGMGGTIQILTGTPAKPVGLCGQPADGLHAHGFFRGQDRVECGCGILQRRTHGLGAFGEYGLPIPVQHERGRILGFRDYLQGNNHQAGACAQALKLLPIWRGSNP
jgi:hypothetical protein